MTESPQHQTGTESAPPHPFREAAWYDPRLTHRPCLCPRCRPALAHPPRLRPFRIVLAVLGAVLLPLIALIVNGAFRVVALGTGGEAAVLLAVIATLANLVFCPTRRDHQRVVTVHPPGSTAARLLLLLGALWSCLVWGYLSLLFVPLLPLSLLALVFFGLGLCGLTPFMALTVSLIQVRRAAVVLGERLGRRRTLLIGLAALLLPILAATVAGTMAVGAQRRLQRQLDLIAKLPPHSDQRIQAIAGLGGGAEEQMPALYLAASELPRRELLAEAYLRLTDERMHGAVERAARQRASLIRPFWFLSGQLLPPIEAHFWLPRAWRF